MNEAVYRAMNETIVPEEILIQSVLKPSAKRFRRFPAAVAAAALCVLLAVPAAAQSNAGYALLYTVAPAAAQFFQPVQMSCTDSGITMEVVSVRVEGSVAQAYIALSGGAVDATADLFDSYSFHVPYDQTGHCRQIGFDESTQTALFLVTTETMDGSPIPLGGKMTFSLRQILSGKVQAEGLAVDLDLADHTGAGQRASGYQANSAPDEEEIPMLLPGQILAKPLPGISITAAGYWEGVFHVQANLGNIHRTDNHCRLWLENAEGEQIVPVKGVYFRSVEGAPEADVYEDFLFEVSPEDLSGYTLYGDFYTASTLTEGNWRITFPLENT